jgi:hypothetical protein
MSTEFFRIEVPRDDATGGDWRARAAANRLRKQQSALLHAWGRKQSVKLIDFSSRESAEKVVAQVQGALPSIPVHVVNYSYLF